MNINIYLAIQPDNDWVIAATESQDNPIAPPPSLPYIIVDSDLATVLSQEVTNGLHVRNLTGYQQSHLTGSPGHLTMTLSDFGNYQTLL